MNIGTNISSHKQASTYFVDPEDSETRVLVLSGLPGVGKTHLAAEICKAYNCIHVNADVVRSTINKHLKFSLEDRLKQAYTLAHIARIIANSGHKAVVDFVAPTKSTRLEFLDALGPHRAYTSWCEVYRPYFQSRYPDTQKMYEPITEDAEGLAIKEFFRYLISSEVPNTIERFCFLESVS